MSKVKHISAVISLKDNMSASLRGIKREQKAFQRDLRQARQELKKTQAEAKRKMQVRMNATAAHKTITKLRKKMEPLRKKVVATIIAKERAMAVINKVKSGLKSVGKFVAKPVVSVKDKATSMLKGLGSKLAMLTKGISIPISIITAGAGVAIKSGMELEQQQVSMKHFMGVGNKGKSDAEIQKMTDSYVSQLRQNANATPFETGEVIASGARALQISNGDVKTAMEKVKLAEDMAAMNPGKTISDAMEAIADMEMGEMARLTEFGVKASSEDDPREVQKRLEKMYSGGAEKLADTGQGKLSTITGMLKSNIADIGLNMTEALKPALDGIIGFVEQISPKMLEFGTKVGEGMGTAISFITENFPKIKEAVEPIITSVMNTFSAVVPVISQLITSLSPVFMGIFSVARSVFIGINSVIQSVVPYITSIISALSPAFNAVGNALKAMGSVFTSIFNKVVSVVKSAYNTIKPLIDKIGGLVSSVSGAVSNVVGAITGKKTAKKKNATGTRYFSGGVSLVGEHGPELVQMPRGSKVYTNTETRRIAKKGNEASSNNVNKATISNSINIAKLAETIIVREEADITKIANKLVEKINQSKVVYGGAY